MSTIVPSRFPGDSDYIPGTVDPAESSGPDPQQLGNRDGASGEQAPVLVLAASSEGEAANDPLSRLSHLLGLDVYGRFTMSDAARIEMNVAAVILVAIFVFDTVGWGLLFYFVVNAGVLDLNPGRLAFAVGGILPATLLLLYERGFMTADTVSRGWKRLLLPMALRMCVIAAAAWITAQPIELMAFGQRIEQRVHEERIREDIVGRHRDLAEQLRARGQAGRGAALVEQAREAREAAKGKLEGFQQRKDAEIAALPRLEREREDLRAVRARASAEMQRAPLPPSETDPTRALEQEAYREAKRRYEKVNAEFQAKVAAVGAARGRLNRLDAEIGRATDERDRQEARSVEGRREESGDLEVKRLRRWAQHLRSLRPGQDTYDRESNFEFRFVDYDFLAKLRIIDDLRQARPARWPGASTTIREQLAEEYGMYDADQATRQIDAATATRTYWSIFGVAVIVPFMSLLFKLIMPTALASYYSNSWQSAQGHPWAMTVETTPGGARPFWSSRGA